ncbi:MAG TPA: PIN domain nuclease [Geminicoccaceae bacterium]|nr:PIN domain nuclease [Geminicoccaceae bacterium]
MIVVDSSVWIDLLRRQETAAVAMLRRLAGDERLVVGDIVMLEVLQGVRSDGEALRVAAALAQYEVRPMLDPQLASEAARHYRGLRGLGVTVRKTVDLIIGTFCIHHRLPLLTSDRDFQPMQEHLGLELVRTTN